MARGRGPVRSLRGNKAQSRPEGLFGADSSVTVTNQINGKNLIELAVENFGERPVVWGRYFTSAGTSGLVEYRHLRENQILRDAGIRVVPIARQTKHVNGTQNKGSADAKLNVEDPIDTFGASYLAQIGGQVFMFLDVEGAPSLSTAYYLGWSQTIVAHSTDFSGDRVTILPCVYATQGDVDTWKSLGDAVALGGTCHGAWVARWKIRGCGPPIPWNDAVVRPKVKIPCDVVLWQYADECHGGNGFDCNRINPAIDRNAFLAKCVLPPETVVA
jgi:hypothetical protein